MQPRFKVVTLMKRRQNDVDDEAARTQHDDAMS